MVSPPCGLLSKNSPYIKVKVCFSYILLSGLRCRGENENAQTSKW